MSTPSLLPKYRGAAPINWALINGEKLTGLTTMQIDAGLDTGPMLLRSELPVDDDETAPQLAARLAEASAPLILETLRRVARDEITAQAQDNAQATLARPLTKEDGLIDWSMAARDIYNRMRGLQTMARHVHQIPRQDVQHLGPVGRCERGRGSAHARYTGHNC